jgi:hypothetical protein
MDGEQYYAATIAGSVSCNSAEDVQTLTDALNAINASAVLQTLHPAEGERIVDDDVSPNNARVPPVRFILLVEWGTLAAGELLVTAPLNLAVEVNEAIEGAGLLWDLWDDDQAKLDALLGDKDPDDER